jgi:cytoskeleton protein RodZ
MNDLSQASTLAEGNEAPELSKMLRDFSVGERLSSSRQEKNWSVQYVAEQLKLSQGQIVALESNQFESLPKLVIVRGFVRAYAKLLKIDADSLIALLPKEVSPMQLETSLRPALSTPFVDSRLSLLGHHDNNRRYIVGAIFLVLLVAIFLIVQRTEFGKNLINMFRSPVSEQSGQDVTIKPVLPGLEVQNASATVDTNLPKLQNSTGSMPALVGADNAAPPIANTESRNLASVALQENHSTAVPAEKVLAPVDAAVSSSGINAGSGSKLVASPVAGLATDTEVLVFKFRENSWIQVKTEGGTVLSSHLARAGTEESFSVKQSLLVRIGNAAGVDATLRGQALTISSERGSNVANLVVK